MAHPTLAMAREGTPQNFALRKGGTKEHVDTDSIRKALGYIELNEVIYVCTKCNGDLGYWQNWGL
jgi:hypothetical protein